MKTDQYGQKQQMGKRDVQMKDSIWFYQDSTGLDFVLT